jgi:hypothetical protein
MTEAEISTRRLECGVSPVKQGVSPPQWLVRKARSAVKSQGLYKIPPYHPREIILRDVVEHVSQSLGIDIWDHPGRTTIGEEACFVLEPYPTSDRVEYEQRLQEISCHLSELLQCSVTWSRESWHYPGWAYRIIFSEG